MNKVILSGNLCKEIELKQTQSGKSALNNSVAVRRDFKDADGTYQTDFIDFIAFGNQAEYLKKYASKGDRVELVGRWQVRNYVDKNGYDRRANEVVVENISLVTPKKKEEQSQEDKSVDDLPF